MPSAFIAALFQWSASVSRFNFDEGFAVQCLRRLSLRPFLGLAYAELKVNFVEGFAVLCLRRLSLRCFYGFAV